MPIGYKGENEDIVVEKFFSPNAGGSVLRMYFPGCIQYIPETPDQKVSTTKNL